VGTQVLVQRHACAEHSSEPRQHVLAATEDAEQVVALQHQLVETGQREVGIRCALQLCQDLIDLPECCDL